MIKSAKMEKIRLIIGKGYYMEAISALHDLGFMQIDPLGENARAALKNVENEDYKRITEYAQRFRSLEKLLYPKRASKRFTFKSMQELYANADDIKIDERVVGIRKELDHLRVKEAALRQETALMGRLTWLGRDIGGITPKEHLSFVLHGKELGAPLKRISEYVPKSSIIGDKRKGACIVLVGKDYEKDFGAVTSKFPHLSVEVLPKVHGHPKELHKIAAEQLEEVARQSKALDDELRVISDKYYEEVNAVKEQFDIELERVEVLAKFGATETTVVAEGWVQVQDSKKTERILDSITHGNFIMERIKTAETPPTKMTNPVTLKLYEFFVKFYSLPRSDEIDPTIMFAVIFPILFGFMVGDVGYGLVMLILFAWIIYRLDHPVKNSKLPKKLTGFVRMIISDNGLKVIAKAVIPGAIVAILLGAAFNEYFGFQLPYTPLLNVESQLSTLLLISGWIGVFMVSFGFLLGILNKLAIGEKKEAVGKAGWLFAGLGFVIFGLNVLHKAALGPSNPMAIVSYVMLIGGVLTILLTEKLNSLMELPSLVSHMLSYTRLVGILLASIILAQVIDFIFLRSWHHSLLLGIVGTLILVIGQIFTLIIAIFEPGIQGARLIYVEFFSKFFTGNGTEFTPFAGKRKTTTAKFSEETEGKQKEV